MPDVHEIIWKKLRVQGGDNLPFRGMAALRNTLPELFRELDYKVGAEIGVRKGEYSKILCDCIPGVKLYCIDHWIPYPMVRSQEKQDDYFRITCETLKPYPNVEIIKDTSVEVAKRIPDGSLDFVHIDGAHDFDNVITDIILWNNKVRRGGMITGHDFYHSFRSGVIFAVEAYTRAHNINPWYVTRDSEPSWFWVKP